MRPSLRTGLGAVLATAVVFSVPVVSSATSTEAQSAAGVAVHDNTQRHFTRDQAARIFNRLQVALAPKHAAPRKLGDPLPRRDLSLLMRDANLARSSLSARQQSIIDSNSPPVPDNKGCTTYTQYSLPLVPLHKWVVLAGPHFCVHYFTSGTGKATLAQAQNTLTAMEFVYDKEVSGLGYNPPLPDFDGKTDVFLDQLGNKGYYGFCTTKNAASSARTAKAWCGLDNDFAVKEFGAPPGNSLKVTAAHEFFHAIQFGYDIGDSTDDWFLEGTAVWMEDQVYPTINDYLQYLKVSQIVKPRNSTDFAGNLERYGAVTFWKFLSERFKDVNIIRQVWNAAAVSAGNRNGIQAVVAVLKARGYSFAPEFATYSVWNTLPPGTYADRGLFPVPGTWGSGTITKKARDTGVLKVKLNHLSTAPLILRAGSDLPSRSKLRVTVNGPDATHGTQARVQLRYKSGKVLTYVVPLNSAGNGSKLFPFNPNYLKSAIVTLTDAGTANVPYFNSQAFTVRGVVSY